MKSSKQQKRARSSSPGRRKRATVAPDQGDSRDVVLLVGGTQVLAKYLSTVHQSKIRLVIGELSQTKGEEAARDWGCEFLFIDIHEEISYFAKVFVEMGIDIIVNASGLFPGEKPILLEAALEAGCHYLDVCDDIHGFAPPMAKKFHKVAVAKGSICVTTAGIFSGLSNLIAAALIEEGGGAETVRLDYFKTGFGFDAMMSLMNGSAIPSTVVRDFQQEIRTTFTGRRLVDFGPIVGKQAVYHFPFPECFSLQEVYQVPSIRAMFAISPEFLNQAMVVTGFLLRLLPRSSKKLFAGAFLLLSPVDYFVGETLAMRIAVVGEDKVLRVHRQTYTDGVEATGSMVARQIVAILEKDFPPGVWFPEEAFKGEARSEIIEHSIAESTFSDVTSSAVLGVLEHEGDLSFVESSPLLWGIERAILALPMTVLLTTVWGWPLPYAFFLMLLVMVYINDA